MRGELARQSKENYILVQCSARAVKKALENAAAIQEAEEDYDGSLRLPVFSNWNEVNNEKPEVLAGQHRIEALREYVEQTDSDAGDLWWICEFYDKDSLPADINMKLRFNRRDLALADRHGQIWNQIVWLSSWDKTLFSGGKTNAEEKIRDMLCLGNEARLPTGRLVTLWRNKRWKPMITRWCSTAVGKEAFNISTWEDMASRRFDDYWFKRLDRVLETLDTFPEDAGNMVCLGDWKGMSRNLSSGYTEAQVGKLFFTDEAQAQEQDHNGGIPSESAAGAAAQRPGFLSALSRQAYDKVCRHIIENPDLRFPDIHQFLRLKKDDTRIMAQVLAHVVGWLNAKPTEVAWQQESTKPLLRKDMVPILEDYASTSILSTGSDDQVDGEEAGPPSRSGQTALEELGRSRASAAVWAERRSIVLEQRVLDFVREHMAAFKGPSNKLYLQSLPKEGDETYSLRFTEDIWKKLDELVREVIGSPQYQPTWKLVDAAGTALSNDTDGDVSSKGLKPVSNITRALCSQLQAIPEVKESPALRGDASSIQLATLIDRVVLEWAARKCRRVLSRRKTDDGRPLSAEEIRQIELDQKKYEELVGGLQEDSASASALTQPHRAISVPRTSELDVEAESQMAGAAADKQYEDNRHAIRRPLPSARVIAASSHASRPSKEKPKTPQVSRHGPSRVQHTSLASGRRRRSTGQNHQKFSQQAAPVSDTSVRKPAWASGIAAASGNCK
ncbi:hypothetical protein TGAMA5MH_03791 [Trichoderma gamsii]|uniref:Uncharacterized protein n=1 Tax=Trichoderma gamsii TaxID=398673 RepID=A0A2K0TFZ5_9HYPO|nr:hypothetical protein TGAMA5MH_03791 [Trichoderma gamsii]